MEASKSQMGRPVLPANVVRSRKVFFRAEPGLYKKLAAAARHQRKPVGTWIRDALTQLLGSE